MKETEPPDKKLETLPRSKEIYTALLASSRDAILGLNRKGTIIFWNKGAEQIFGYSTGQILGQPVTELMSEKHRENHTKGLRAFLSGNSGATKTIEFEALSKDGSAFLVNCLYPFGSKTADLWDLPSEETLPSTNKWSRRS